MTLRFPAAVRVLRAALVLAVSTALAAAAFARADDGKVEIRTGKVAGGVPKAPGTRSENVVDTLPWITSGRTLGGRENARPMRMKLSPMTNRPSAG